ncbi:MAG: winged helix-turn-helix domain-containing protein [Ramlibacter sp.]|nr:winged helix-turn-helix domain-containing protein [Ramlibacter sp.]
MNDRSWSPQASSRLALGSHVLDLAAGELLQADGERTPLRRQALEVLLVLGRRHRQVVTRDELDRLVWPGLVVGEGSLIQAIADIRRVLQDHDHRLVRTVARRGYLLAAQPAPAPPAGPEAPAPAVTAGATPLAPAVRTGFGRRMAVLAGTAALLATAALYLAPGWQRATAPRAPGPFSMVVLPLASEGAAEEGRWFADMLHADLVSQLGQLSGTMVISRETASRFTGPAQARTIARELKVRYVVTGSVRRQGPQVHLRLAMTDGDTGAQAWAQQLVVPRAGLQEALEGISQQLARTLQVQMYRASGAKAQTLPPERLQADDIAMQGWGFYFRGASPDNYKLALERFEAALAKDPDSLRAWGGVEAVMGMSGLLNWVPRERALARLHEAVLRLQALDEDDFYTHLAKMFVASLQDDWDALLHTATAAAKRFPSHPAPHAHQAGALAALGMFQECIDASGRALQRGPRDYAVGAFYMYMGTCHFMLGQYRQAAAAARAGHQANPLLPSPPVLLIASMVQLGELDEARTRAADYLQRNPRYRASDFARFLRGRHPSYLTGRDRAIESLRAAGMP